MPDTERTRTGVKAAQSRGVKFGRKLKLSPPQVTYARKLVEAGEPVAQVAKLLNVDRARRSIGICIGRRPSLPC